jgi:hypothetical protein
MTDEIILNRIQCNFCKDILTSRFRHDYVTCSCSIEPVSADGGRAYLKRCYSPTRDDKSLPYTEQSITSSAPFEEVRKALMRGSRGKNGDQPLTWVPLAEISNEYLSNLITYQEQNMYTDSIDYTYQLMERQYRKHNNVVIEEN